MTTPSVDITKSVFTTGQAPASTTGILAILACSSQGTNYVPGGFARTDLAVGDKGYGPLTDFFAYNLDTAHKQALLVKGNAGVPATYGSVTVTSAAGTATATASLPFDTYNVVVTITVGGTVGITGIRYTYSMDGGLNVSGEVQLGVPTTLTIPNTGVAFTVGGIFAVGDTIAVRTKGPQLSNTDVTAGLTALGMSRLPFEGVLIDCSANSSTVGLVDAVLSGWERRGVFKFALINSRFKTEPSPTAETEADYATALSATFNNSTSIRMCVGADGGHIASSISGFALKRPTALILASRAMSIPIGEDPAYVARGPLANVQISDNASNPLDHDEDLYPNLDPLRLTTLRSFPAGGPNGTYICNARTIQPNGGAFPYLQHIRIMNRACEIAWAILTQQLSLGVRKNPKKDPVTGAVTIFEQDAAKIDALVNEALFSALKGQVSDVNFAVSRTDDLSQDPVTVTAVLDLVAQAYIKNFAVQAQFRKTLSTEA